MVLPSYCCMVFRSIQSQHTPTERNIEELQAAYSHDNVGVNTERRVLGGPRVQRSPITARLLTPRTTQIATTLLPRSGTVTKVF